MPAKAGIFFLNNSTHEKIPVFAGITAAQSHASSLKTRHNRLSHHFLALQKRVARAD
jgi:hypothetical protein